MPRTSTGTSFSGPAGRPELWSRVAAASALAAVALFATLQLYAPFPHEGDENIYVYLASRAAEGVLPYRDFFYGHPPLHLLPAILAFRITGGFELIAIRSISIGAAIVAGLLLYRGGRRAQAAARLLPAAGLPLRRYTLNPTATSVLRPHIATASAPATTHD